MIHEVINFLNTTAFHMFGVGTSWAEIFGFITGLACVYLVAVNNIWNFPIGLINAAMFLVLFWHANLFADSSLQVMFLVLNAWGWYVWLRRGPNSDRRPILSDLAKHNGLLTIGLMAFTALFTLFFREYLSNHGDAYPLLDALTTGMSISAQILLSLKYIENWVWWIVVDLFYIPLYTAKDLWLTAIVYVCFLGISIGGLILWRRTRAYEQQTGGQAVDFIAPKEWVADNG